jgi:hypothetical protein
MLRVPDLASIQILSERSTSDTCAAALTVDDVNGDRYLVIRVLTREADEWHGAGGSEGLDRTITGKYDPYLPMYAYASGRFFGGGRVHSTAADVARVRLVWEDGYQLEEEVENTVVLLLGARDSLDPATVEFLNRAGCVVGRHPAFVDEPDEGAETLSTEEAFAAMFEFLKAYRQELTDANLEDVLSDLNPAHGRKSSDQAMWDDWLRAVQKVLNQRD